LIEEAAVATKAAVNWKIAIEGTDAFGEVRRHEIRVDKSLSVEDGKKILAALQTVVVSQEADTYTLFRRICPDCGVLRPVKDYTTRRIRLRYGGGSQSPLDACRNCAFAFAPLCEICPDRATPELRELTARLGSMMPYRQAASVLAEFLPLEPTETHATVRKRTIRTGERLDRQAAEEERSAASQVRDRRQLELDPADEIEDVSTSRLRSLGAQLFTYVVSNRSAIINYGKRYRAGLRVASTLAESAVNSLVGKRMAKNQQMSWSVRGAHMLMQVRTADINGELRDRLRAEFRKPDHPVPSVFRPKPPLLRAA